jgi:hypothetical protein
MRFFRKEVFLFLPVHEQKKQEGRHWLIEFAEYTEHPLINTTPMPFPLLRNFQEAVRKNTA